MSWGEPLTIGNFYVLRSTAAAADYLLENWPYEARGTEYWLALENCLADHEGKPSKARECFIAAAKAAALNITCAKVH